MAYQPLITVIIPSYNSPDLKLTLNSLLMQDYPRIQTVLVDDHSRVFDPEKTLEFLQKHNRGNLEQITVLRNSENRGTVYTMNRALQEAKGEYIFNLACDDCFQDAQVLSDWVKAFQCTGAHVMTGYRTVWNRDMTVCLGREPQYKQVAMLWRKPPRVLFEELAKANFVFGSCTARTAESFQRFGLYDESYRLIEDHPAHLKMLREGEPIVFFERVVVQCRSGGTSSAENYNHAYAADVDRILRQEVLPYTRHPLSMRWHYFQWKREQRILKKRAALLTRYGRNGLAKAAIGLWYYSHHPVRILIKLPLRIFRRKGA